MAKRKTVVPFHGTAEQEKALRELIAAHKEQQGALMPVLQGAQELYGYLPIEVQDHHRRGAEYPFGGASTVWRPFMRSLPLTPEAGTISGCAWAPPAM